MARFNFPPPNNFEEIAQVISLFLAFLALKGLAFGTIDNYLHGVQAFFMDDSLGAVNVRSFYLVRQVLSGIKQQIGHLPKPKFAILVEFLLAMKLQMSGHITDKRDWCLFLFAFWGLLRKSELLELCWDNISALDGGISIFIASSKTDKDKKGMRTTLAKRGDSLCPVRAFIDYASLVPVQMRSPHAFFALSTKKKNFSHSRLASSSFVGRVKHWIQMIGLDPVNYSGHSFRRGGATAMARAGISPEIIQIQGRWRSDAYKLYLQVGVESLLKASSIPL